MKKMLVILVGIVVLFCADISAGWLPEFAPKIPSKTEAELKLSTPTAAGKLYYDSTNKAIVVSTGTLTCFDYGIIYAGGTAPTGW